MYPDQNHVVDLQAEVYDTDGMPHQGFVQVVEEGLFIGDVLFGQVGITWDELIRVLQRPEVQERIEQAEIDSP